jgi:hypothetical protein
MDVLVAVAEAKTQIAFTRRQAMKPNFSRTWCLWEALERLIETGAIDKQQLRPQFIVVAGIWIRGDLSAVSLLVYYCSPGEMR